MSCTRLKRIVCLLVIALLAGAPGLALAAPAGEEPSPSAVLRPPLRDVLRGVENKYNRLKSMKAHFQQTVRQGTGVLRSEQGELYLSKPGRMRWEYESPETKLFLTDGKSVILYLPEENRVMESAIKETEDIKAPLAFLLGRLNFDEQFQKMETSPQLAPVEKGNIVFKAYSKQLAERVEWVLFEVTPEYEIRRVVARERGGLETEFRFNAMVTNPQLADSMFRFTAPAGAEVVRE
jgi:outer membrane lipoprotein carrier protein